MLNDWQLLQPYWLALFILLWIAYRAFAQTGLNWAKLISPITLRYPPLLHSNKEEVNHSQQALISLRLSAIAASCFILALSQPVMLKPSNIIHKNTDAIDVVLVVGTSVSMVLRDYEISQKPLSRMQMTKYILKEFINDFKGQRLALVILGNPGAVWLPLSKDRELVQQAVQRLRPTLGGRLSDLAGTLNLVAKKFANPQRETAVLLVSDGGLQVGENAPQQGAKALAQAGLILHSITIGTGPQGKESMQGNLLHSAVDTELMRDIAEITGGKRFHIDDSTALQAAFKQASQAQLKVIDSHAEKIHQPLYPWLLAIGIFLLAIQQSNFPYPSNDRQS